MVDYLGVDNAVFRVNTITNENARVFNVTREVVLIRSFTNAGNSKSLGAELNANIDAGKISKFFIGGSLYNTFGGLSERSSKIQN